MDGRDESAPTPTECTLRIVHVHQHLPTCTHCDAGAFTLFGADGRDESAPTPTECTLRIVHVHQRLPTCTHCRGRFIVPAYYGIYGVGISVFH